MWVPSLFPLPLITRPLTCANQDISSETIVSWKVSFVNSFYPAFLPNVLKTALNGLV
jgi:hypothetical protein